MMMMMMNDDVIMMDGEDCGEKDCGSGAGYRFWWACE